LRSADATRLKRPSTFEMAEALKAMGFTEEQSQRTARECDRSVTILARRIPSAVAKLPSWHQDQP
jgi:Holliday junction resolvasome RuvABC DNA-binding subunit